ncbi:hypothetical protein [Aliivibrio fischeri]|uniref:hypothetical protein n=1 Tax=Aliivibrio fischeri TaxID=668 RepID=UPI0007C4657B|nr:hypothetical protein [Aliivibrio fischeri]
MKTHLTIGKTAMTHSTAINSTITKETKATNVSPFEQSGSNKNECLKSENFPDFLSVFGKHDLILKSIGEGFTVAVPPPENGWTYEALADVDFLDISFQYATFCSWNIYIGGCHLGHDEDWLYMARD